ncbi:alpha/beta fold hydrolase [Streptomyces hygroscopicus]|uniref:alpha/beta fold hydrolase n=1 Tax=Streptomyces hygroscopicus TaxID=1912 RepID=UPI00367B9CFB
MPATISFPVATPGGPRTARVVHERRGAGRPLVLLHGIGHHWQAWQPVLDILAVDRDVIAVDLPGFGASETLPDGIPYDVDGVIPVLGALFEALGVERPDVAGNSLGGLLALELGRAGLVRSVTALAPARFWTEANAATPSVCSPRCGPVRGRCRRRWWRGWPAARPGGPR